MAKRPVFKPVLRGDKMVITLLTEFTWHPGLSKTQKRKSICSLHNAAQEAHYLGEILEISSKSESNLGVNLSAFNLKLKLQNGETAPIEVLFQGSKVFSGGGPYTDMYSKTSREAKKDPRLMESGRLVAFEFEGAQWPLVPQTVFYDWLYISALKQNPTLASDLFAYDAFTDIEFNPQKSINCQAASAALYKALRLRDLLDMALTSPEEFLRVHKEQKTKPVPIQQGLF